MTAEKGVGLEDFAEPLVGSYSLSWGVSYMVDDLLDQEVIDLDPDYQRRHVWTLNQQESFIGHLIEGGTAPDLWMRELPYGAEHEYECVDGKQRITAMAKWWRGEICARLSRENGYERIWLKDMSPREKRYVKRNLIVPRVQVLRGYSRAQALHAYLRLNRGGTPHTEEEISRVEDMYRKEVVFGQGVG